MQKAVAREHLREFQRRCISRLLPEAESGGWFCSGSRCKEVLHGLFAWFENPNMRCDKECFVYIKNKPMSGSEDSAFRGHKKGLLYCSCW